MTPDSLHTPPLPESGPASRLRQTRFQQDRDQLTALLLRHVLLKSYWRCRKEGYDYPFAEPESVLPGQDSSDGLEKPGLNTAFLVCVDGSVPTALNKHFRLRGSNRVTWRNLHRFGPKLDLSGYKSSHCRFDSEAFDGLLGQLLPLDYALLLERPGGEDAEQVPLMLTHMHVKVERLTDNAIKELGKSLGYIERRLFERGEDYVETLESKFFEYYGFSERASGRKSAAAMAAQLLASNNQRKPMGFAVYVASQEDGRLTVLDDSDVVTQYALAILPIPPTAPAPYQSQAYCVDRRADGTGVFILRLALARTDAARTGGKRRQPDELLTSWLQIADEAIVPLPGNDVPAVPIKWVKSVS